MSNTCPLCGRPIAGRFVWCGPCAATLGITGAPMSSWPESVRTLYRVYNRDRMRDRVWQRRETAFSDLSRFHPFVSGWLDDSPEQSTSSSDSRGGSLTCVRCGTTFRDVWPTWPVSPPNWQLPVCPTCGGGRFRESK
jgi:hypothetical protein